MFLVQTGGSATGGGGFGFQYIICSWFNYVMGLVRVRYIGFNTLYVLGSKKNLIL